MIITRTPYRISLFGGNTDRPEWYRQHGGEVLGFAIDKYCYLSLRKLPPFFEHKSRIVWSKIELVKEHSEIKHPAARAILENALPESRVELHHDGDLPARSGLGSSSSFTVGLLNAVAAFKGTMATKEQLALQAIHVERDILKENVGSQDQIWAAYGGFNRIEFHANDTWDVKPVILPKEREKELLHSFMLFFTGISRFGSEVAQKQIEGFRSNARQLQALRSLVGEAMAVLQSPQADLREIGALLHEGWKLKRGLAEGVSNGVLDTIYEAGRAAGAIGGKVLGAGGGGFILFHVPKEAKSAVRARLSHLVEVPFGIAYEGSRVIVYEPNGW